MVLERSEEEKRKCMFGCGGENRWVEQSSCHSYSPRGKLHSQEKGMEGKGNAGRCRRDLAQGRTEPICFLCDRRPVRLG